MMNAQNKTNNNFYVYFSEGIMPKDTIIQGNKFKKTKIFKSSLFNSLRNIGIIEDSVSQALPKFNLVDTLKRLTNGTIISQANLLKLYKIKTPKGKEQYEILNYLKKLSEVLYVEPIAKGVLYKTPDDPLFNQQLSLTSEINQFTGLPNNNTISAQGAWDIYTGNPNNIIAIIDAPVNYNHEDLTTKLTGGDRDYYNTYPNITHGTEVAGIAAAASNNGKGICGIDWAAKIYPRTYNKSNEIIGYNAIMDAVNYSPNVFVINCSWGIEVYSPTLRQAIAYAYKNNRTVIAAIGNTGEVTEGSNPYPGAFDNVITVGTVDMHDVQYGSISRSYIDVCAPGSHLITTSENSYTQVNGSSVAAPIVSGIASILKGYNPNLANDDIENIIKLSADKVEGMHGAIFDNNYGYGRVNCEKALKFLISPYNLVQQTVTSGTIISTSDPITTLFIGASSLTDGYYSAKRIELQKTVPLPNNLNNIIGAWGRGVFSNGWKPVTENYGEGFCEVVPGSVTNSNLTLRTYVYDITSLLGVHLGYYPVSPANATFAYSVLGVEKPTITGPSQICNQGTYTINNLPTGATVSWIATPTNIVSYPATGNPATLTKVGNGKMILTALINNSITLTKAISVGSPQMIGIGSFSNLAYEDNNTFKILSGTGYYYYEGKLNVGDDGLGTSYSWSLITNYTTGKPIYWTPSGSSVDVATKFSDTSITLKCTSTNSCGSYSTFYMFHTGDLPPFIIAPNPASTQVEVSFTETTAIDSPKSITGNTSVVSYAVKVVDSFGLTVYSAITNEKKFTIPTLSFKNGIYSVQVSDGIHVYQNKLIVTH